MSIYTHNTKTTTLYISSKKFVLKYGLSDIIWLGHSIMKPVDNVVIQKIKAM